MLLTVSNVIDNDRLRFLSDTLSKLSWRDGRATAGGTAKSAKRNEQADLSTKAGAKFRSEAMTAISSHPVILAATRPRRFSNPLLSRTADGGFYGPHIDNAIMKKGTERIRSDVSYTLFLSPADAYDGGELVIHTAGIEQAVKGDIGDLVLYPSNSIHEVRPVTRGVRMVFVGWIESLVADPTQRELLFDLENLRVSLRSMLPVNSAERLTLDKSIANLLRMWVEP